MVAVKEVKTATGTSGTVTVTTSTDVATNDIIVAFTSIALGLGGSPTLPAAPGGNGSGWVTVGESTANANARCRVYARPVTASGVAQTVTVPGIATGGAPLTVLVVNQADVNDLFAGQSPVAGQGSGLSITLGSVSSDELDALELLFYSNMGNPAAANFTPPAGFTERSELAASTFHAHGVSTADLPGPSSTGSRTVAATQQVGWASVHVVIRNGVIPINAADSGAGAETVALAPSLGAADSAAGSDSTSITAALSAADQGTGAEQVSYWGYTGQYEAGTGTDSASAQALQAAAPTDSGSGSEAASITSILDPTTDSGSGLETVGLLRQSTIADSGAGQEKTVGIGPTLHDSGVGAEDVRVREIAATRVLPIVPERRYEVVVAARIQQASGAPTFLEVEAVTWLSLAYTDTLSAPQDLTLTCQLATLPENVLTHLRRPDLFPFELWVRRDGQIIFAGPLQGWQVQDQKVTVKASGLLAYLGMMGVDFDRQFLAADQAVVVKTLVDAWQLTDYGHFGIDTTKMTPTGRLVDVSYVRDELPGLLRAVQELGVADGGFDVEVDPQSRQLTLWSPQRGTDRSEGEDAIVLDARNVTSSNLLCSIAPADLASDVFATGSKSGGDAPLWSAVSNGELRAKYGRTVTTRSYSNVADQAQLDAYAAAVRDARSRAFIVPGTKVRVTPDADIADYREGDTVSYDLGGELGTSGAFRIRSRTVTVDESGRESVDLEPV